MANKEKENKPVELPAAAEKQRELLLNPTSAEQQGAVQVTANVIAQIIKRNVLQVEGVARFAPKGMADIVNVFSNRSYDSSIGIEFTDGAVSVSIAVLAYLGTSLPKMAQEIQEKVRAEIVAATGAEVRKVNVVVRDLVVAEEEESAEGEDEAKEAE